MSTRASFRPKAVRRFLDSLATEDREVLERALDEIDSGALKCKTLGGNGESVASWDMYVYAIFDGAEHMFHFILPGGLAQKTLHPENAVERLGVGLTTPAEARRFTDRLRELAISKCDTIGFLAIGRDRDGRDASVWFWHHPALDAQRAKSVLKSKFLYMLASIRGKN